MQSSPRAKIIWVFVLILMASVQAIANCATHEQRVLINELSLAAVAIAVAAALVWNKIKLGVYFPGLNKK
ncbi:MAG TPA: hypothetical protein VHT68_09660 [Pseudolabrys sp.]|jgi:hypothetical protein|nr:hypothetical protein [Pseudolabrys sp.]